MNKYEGSGDNLSCSLNAFSMQRLKILSLSQHKHLKMLLAKNFTFNWCAFALRHLHFLSMVILSRSHVTHFSVIKLILSWLYQKNDTKLAKWEVFFKVSPFEMDQIPRPLFIIFFGPFPLELLLVTTPEIEF